MNLSNTNDIKEIRSLVISAVVSIDGKNSGKSWDLCSLFVFLPKTSHFSLFFPRLPKSVSTFNFSGIFDEVDKNFEVIILFDRIKFYTTEEKRLVKETTYLSPESFG